MKKTIAIKPGRDLSAPVLQAAKPANQQAVLPANRQTGKPASLRVATASKPSGGPKKKTFYFPAEVARALRLYCSYEDVTETDVVVAAVRRHLGGG